MEIILKKDIKNLGYANDIVNVKTGYARNYLIPKGLAIIANESNRKILAENLRQMAHKENKIIEDANEMAKALDGITVKIGAKASETGKIFGSVNDIQISEALKAQFKYDIDRKKIIVDGDSIKEIGTYTAEIKLYKDISASINFEVTPE